MHSRGLLVRMAVNDAGLQPRNWAVLLGHEPDQLPRKPREDAAADHRGPNADGAGDADPGDAQDCHVRTFGHWRALYAET